MTEHLRAHLEAIRDEAAAFLRQTMPDAAYNPAVGALERIHSDAAIALALLTDSKREYIVGDTDNRIVYDPPDPVPGSTIATRETHT